MIKILSINKNYKITSYGTGGGGYYEHRGVTIKLSNGTTINGYFKYNPRGYGAFRRLDDVEKYAKLNGRRLNKHKQYKKDVINEFNALYHALTKMVGKEYTSERVIMRLIRSAGKK